MACDAQSLINLAASSGYAGLSRRGLAEAMAGLAAPKTGFDPKSISGLALWLDAYQGVEIGHSTVVKWADQSGNGNDAVRDTTTGRNVPLYITNGPNGLPAMGFTGASVTFPDSVPPFNLPGSNSILKVVNPVCPAPLSVFVVAAPYGGNFDTWFLGNNYAAGFGINNAGRELKYRDPSQSGVVNSPANGPNSYPYNESALFELIVDGTVTPKFLVNAVDVGLDGPWTDAPGGPTSGFNNGLTVGAGFLGPPSGYFHGYISEIVIYNRALTLSERQQVEAYLVAKWGTDPNSPMVSSTDPSDILISWGHAFLPDTNEVWVSRNGADYVLLASVAGDVTSVHDTTGMSDGDDWSYKVRGVIAGTNTEFTSPVSVLNNYVIPTVDFWSRPDVKVVLGDLYGFERSDLVFVDLSGVATSESSFYFFGDPNLTTLDLGSLTSCAFILCHSDPALSTVSLNSLTTADELTVASNSITSLNLPVLANVGGNGMDVSSTLLEGTLSLPSLTSLGSDFNCSGCIHLTGLSIPLLGQFDSANFRANGCPLLTSVDLSLWLPMDVNGEDTFAWDFSGCALDQTSVDLLIARVRASYDLGNIQFGSVLDVSGGTSSVPSTTGLADKAYLNALVPGTIVTNA